MKPLMSTPTLLTVIVVAGVIALIPLSQPPLPISAYSDSDDSETNAEQRLGQKNLGSGESSDFNCAEILIKAGTEGNCDKESPEEEPPEEGSATLFVCKVVNDPNQEFEPFDFQFSVTGPGQDIQFPGVPLEDQDADCPPGSSRPGEVVPGEYVIRELTSAFVTPPDSIEVEGDCTQIDLPDVGTAAAATVEIQEGETGTLICTFTNNYEAGSE